MNKPPSPLSRLGSQIGARLDSLLGFAGGNASTPVRPVNAAPQGWYNVGGLGYGSHSLHALTSLASPRIFSEEECVALFEGDGLANRVATLLPQEALRQGYEVMRDGEPIPADAWGDFRDALPIFDAEGSRGLDVALHRALLWHRVYGGSAILLICGDSRDLAAPLDEASPRVQGLAVLSRFDLEPPISASPSPLSPPSPMWRLRGTGQAVHRSRLLFFGRSSRPPRLASLSVLQGWDAPIWTRYYAALSACGSVDANAAEAVHRYTLTKRGVRGLAEMLAGGGSEVLRLLGETQWLSSAFRAQVYDLGNEEISRESLSVSGLAEMMDRFPYRVCAVEGVPVTLLMGQSPSGLSTDDKSGRSFFYAMIKAGVQEGILRPALARLLTLLSRTEGNPLSGAQKTDLEFLPLEEPSLAERAEASAKTSAQIVAMLDTGVLIPSQVRVTLRDGVPEYEIDADPTATKIEGEPTPPALRVV